MTDGKIDNIDPAGTSPDPASPHHAPIIGTTNARGGVTLGRMRWVLGLGIALVVGAFLIVWLMTGRS